MPILDRDHDARTRVLAHMVGRRHRRDPMRIDDLLQAFERVAKASAKLRRAGLARLQRDGNCVLQQDVRIEDMGAVAALWGTGLALRFRSQSAAPLMQAGMFVAVLMTTAYAPQELLQGWLYTVSQINPVTHVIEAARQGFTSEVTWAGTWPAFVALGGMWLVLGAFALREMHRITED